MQQNFLLRRGAVALLTLLGLSVPASTRPTATDPVQTETAGLSSTELVRVYVFNDETGKWEWIWVEVHHPPTPERTPA